MRCHEFWDKWEREPNFCGLSPQSVSEIKGYLELRDKVVKMGVPKATFYENCSSGACRPLLRLADDETRTKGTNYIISSLKRGEKITQGDLQNSINDWLGKEKHCKTPSKNEEKSTQMRTDDKSDPSGKPLSEAIAKDEPHGTETKQSPFKNGSQVNAGLAGEMYPDPAPDSQMEFPGLSGWDLSVCMSGTCPDKMHHFKENPEKKRMECDLQGKNLAEIQVCPIIDRKSRAAAQAAGGSAFATAAGNPSLAGRPIIDERSPLKIRKTSLTEQERNTYADALIERTDFTPKDQEQIRDVIRAGHDGCKNSYLFIEIAVMKYLASMEGE